MGASKTLGIVGICIGWLIPFAGVVLGIIGLCLKKEKAVALNVISIVVSIVSWLFWMAIFLRGL